MYQQQAAEIRAVEEWFLERAKDGTLPGTTHTCIGQEPCAVALGAVVADGDFITSTHRNHGHFLACGGSLEDLITQVMARGKRSPGSQHTFFVSGGKTFISSGVQGNLVPIALGVAFSFQLKNDSTRAWACMGDGTMGQGVVYESLSFAAMQKLPITFFIEANGWAQSTPTKADWKKRIEGFGLPVLELYTDHTIHHNVTQLKTFMAMVGNGPCAVIHYCDRVGPHSRGHDERDPGFIEKLCDPVASYPYEVLEAARKKVVAAAQAEYSPHKLPPRADTIVWPQSANRAPCQGVIAMRRALQTALDNGAILLGQDIRDPAGGAFKVTRGLSKDSPEGDPFNRVYNMPISEAAMVGIGTGLAIDGHLAIVEIMFGDFLPLAADQLINGAAKLSLLHGLHMPLVVRTPVGPNHGYGPTHSQSLEGHFLGVPGLDVRYWSPHSDPGHIIRQAYKHGRPTLLVEPKVFYSLQMPNLGARPLPNGTTASQASIRPQMPACPVGAVCVAIGGAAKEASEAITELEREGIGVYFHCPAQIEAVERDIPDQYHDLPFLVVEHGNGTSSSGRHVISTLRSQYKSLLSAHYSAIYANRETEEAMFPTVEQIVYIVKVMMGA